jgi:hypothetical protein
MLGREDYTQEEFDQARSAMSQTLEAYTRLAEAVGAADADPGLASALEALEPLLFNNLTLALDRHFVHRLRMVTGKDGNRLNEVELVADSLMNNGGNLRVNNVIRCRRGEAVLELEAGEPIRISAGEFDRLSAAFLGEIEAKFVG